MANKNKSMMVAYYANEDAATNAAAELKKWDKANQDVKLGAIAIVTHDPKKDKLKVSRVGERKAKSGALWGTAVGVTAGLMTGGLGLIPAALLGAGGGGAMGAMFHKKVGVSDEERKKIEEKLRAGGAALVVMADDFEVDATKAEMARGGGEVEAYEVPAETVEAIEEAVEANAEAAAEVDKAVAAATVVAVEEAVTDGAAVGEDAGDNAGAAATIMAEEAAVSEAVVDGAAPAEDAVAKIIAATNLNSIDATRLHEAGVEEPTALLWLAATPHGRKELAEASGVREATILAGVKKIDLMRLGGPDMNQIALLQAAGVDSVPKLAKRNAKTLRPTLAEVNADKHIVEELPTSAQLEDWVTRAKEAPHIITY